MVSYGWQLEPAARDGSWCHPHIAFNPFKLIQSYNHLSTPASPYLPLEEQTWRQIKARKLQKMIRKAALWIAVYGTRLHQLPQRLNVDGCNHDPEPLPQPTPHRKRKRWILFRSYLRGGGETFLKSGRTRPLVQVSAPFQRLIRHILLFEHPLSSLKKRITYYTRN
jgi:hypothetical protein